MRRHVAAGERLRRCQQDRAGLDHIGALSGGQEANVKRRQRFRRLLQDFVAVNDVQDAGGFGRGVAANY